MTFYSKRPAYLRCSGDFQTALLGVPPDHRRSGAFRRKKCILMKSGKAIYRKSCVPAIPTHSSVQFVPLATLDTSPPSPGGWFVTIYFYYTGKKFHIHCRREKAAKCRVGRHANALRTTQRQRASFCLSLCSSYFSPYFSSTLSRRAST